MIRRILSVGGFTLLSRLTGFLRDVVLAAILGAGPLMDAFTVALRLPNHFRAIFAEGAFSAAFIPTYAQALAEGGAARARLFQGAMLGLTIISQLAILAPAMLFTEQAVRLLAPGFADDPEMLSLAVTLTRLTFPYLPLIAVVTLWSSVMNADQRFAIPAAAPILLNLSIIGAVLFAAFFPGPAHAAAAGVLIAGVLEAALLYVGVRGAGLFAAPRLPRFGGDVGRFLKRFGPAVIGSAGVQIAMLADTVLATLLPAGSPSALYYADRLYQLPLGVIAIAGGTVLLPEMARRLAEGDAEGAHRAQASTTLIVLFLAAPCVAGFLMVGDLAIEAVFQRGAFDAAATALAAEVLMAYAVGLPAAVLIQTVRPSFQARGDTTTPMVASLIAIAANVALKFVLTPPLGVAGLALATSAGAWINLAILAWLALASGKAVVEAGFWRMVAVIAAATAASAAPLVFAPWMRAPFAGLGAFEAPLALLAAMLAAGIVYLAVVVAGARIAGAPLPLPRRRGAR
jgi:putative peptidoglycan lipid II flippase